MWSSLFNATNKQKQTVISENMRVPIGDSQFILANFCVFFIFLPLLSLLVLFTVCLSVTYISVYHLSITISRGEYKHKICRNPGSQMVSHWCHHPVTCNVPEALPSCSQTLPTLFKCCIVFNSTCIPCLFSLLRLFHLWNLGIFPTVESAWVKFLVHASISTFVRIPLEWCDWIVEYTHFNFNL